MISNISEHYLKTDQQLRGEQVEIEVDLYEEHIRGKISDL